MRRRLWRVAKCVVLGVLAVVVAMVAVALVWRWVRHHELTVATAVNPVTGVDEAVVAKIGGVDQWIGIRGRNRRAPILVVLHGGPGIAMSPFGRDVFERWRYEFVVVLWDQRGAGKTYGLSGPLDSSVTIDRMVSDGIEVIDFVRKPPESTKSRHRGRVVGIDARRPDREGAPGSSFMRTSARTGDRSHEMGECVRTRPAVDVPAAASGADRFRSATQRSARLRSRHHRQPESLLSRGSLLS